MTERGRNASGLGFDLRHEVTCQREGLGALSANVYERSTGFEVCTSERHLFMLKNEQDGPSVNLPRYLYVLSI